MHPTQPPHPSPQPYAASLPYPIPPGHPTARNGGYDYGSTYGPPVDAPNLPPTQSFAPTPGAAPMPIPMPGPMPAQIPMAWQTQQQPFGLEERSPRSRTVAGVLEIFGGWVGLGRFYGGDVRRGGIHLAIFTAGALMPNLGILSVLMVGYGVIDGMQILVLNMRDDRGRLLSD